MSRAKQLRDGETVAFHRNALVILKVLPCEQATVCRRTKAVQLLWKHSRLRFDMACEKIVEGSEAAFRNFEIVHVDVKTVDGLLNTIDG